MLNDETKFDPLAPDFDRDAYREYLIKQHDEIMQSGATRGFYLNPPTLDLYRPEFDVEAYIDDAIQHAKAAKKYRELQNFLHDLSEQIKESDPLRELKEKLEAMNPLKGLAEQLKEIQAAYEAAKAAGFFDDLEDEADTEEPPKPSRRALATEQGAITTIDGRLTAPSDKGTELAFTSYAIKALPKNSDDDYTIDENGQLTFLDPPKFEDVMKLHGAFLYAMLSCFVKAANADMVDVDNQILKFYTVPICRELGIDPRKYASIRPDKKEKLSDLRFKALYAEIEPFERYVGNVDGVYYRVLMFRSYDENSDVMAVEAPYIFQLFEQMRAKAEIIKHSQFNQLLHANVVNEANYAAVELANRIIIGVLQRGAPEPPAKKRITKRTTKKKNGDQVTEYYEPTDPADASSSTPAPAYSYTPSYIHLINDCPQLMKKLKSIEDGDAKNKNVIYNMTLKRTFELAYQIILEKSDLPKVFKDLRINGVEKWESTLPRKKGERRRAADFRIPTRTRLNTTLTITHNGRVTDIGKN